MDHGHEMRPKFGEVRAARLVRFASRCQVHESLLCATRILERNDQEMRRRDALQDHALDVFRMTARVVEEEFGAIRAAVEDDLRVTERGSKGIEIVCGD